jgi:hypothetical protein
MSKTVRVTVAAVPLLVEYVAPTSTHAEILRVWPDSGLDDIKDLLAPDVTNSLRVACIKHERSEIAFLRRVEEQERTEA